jgi:hypothetical protein
MLIHYASDGYQVTSGLYSLVYDRRFRFSIRYSYRTFM